MIRWDDRISGVFRMLWNAVCTVLDVLKILPCLRVLGKLYRRYVDWVLGLQWRRGVRYALAHSLVVGKRSLEFVAHLYVVRLRRVLRFWIFTMVMLLVPMAVATSAKEGKLLPPYTWIDHPMWVAVLQTISWSTQASWVGWMTVSYWILLIPTAIVGSPIIVPYGLVYLLFFYFVPATSWFCTYGFLPLRLLYHTFGHIFDGVFSIILKDLLNIGVLFCKYCIVPILKVIVIVAQFGWGLLVIAFWGLVTGIPLAVVGLWGAISTAVRTFWGVAA